MRSVFTFAALALTAGIIVPRYASHMGEAPGPAALTARPAPPVGELSSASRSIIVSRDHRGHFQVDARVDGRHLNFMVDTGATVVALTESEAAGLGIHPAPYEFVVDVKTANGTVRGAPIKLDRIEVGDIVVRDVAALVMPDRALSDNLLGLSFLSRLRRFEYTGGKLVLEQ